MQAFRSNPTLQHLLARLNREMYKLRMNYGTDEEIVRNAHKADGVKKAINIINDYMKTPKEIKETE